MWNGRNVKRENVMDRQESGVRLRGSVMKEATPPQQ